MSRNDADVRHCLGGADAARARTSSSSADRRCSNHVRESAGAASAPAEQARTLVLRTDYRVPAATSLVTAAAFSFVTKPGPVLIGRPPPRVFLLVAAR